MITTDKKFLQEISNQKYVRFSSVETLRFSDPDCECNFRGKHTTPPVKILCVFFFLLKTKATVRKRDILLISIHSH